jgi:hypothetical protein
MLDLKSLVGIDLIVPSHRIFTDVKIRAWKHALPLT